MKTPTPDDFRRSQADIIDRNDPQASFRQLRDTCPVLESGGITYLLLHDDIDAALRDPATFASSGRAALGNIRPRIPVDIDPPDHLRYRKILDPLFAPREMARFEPEFRALAHRLIDGFANRGTCDFASEFAIPLPSLLFLSLLGLPLEDLPLLLELKDSVLRPPADNTAEHLGKMAARILKYFEGHLSSRDTSDKGTVISRILTAEQDGERLTRDEVLDVLFMFVLAGLDTVTASLECFVVHLARNPQRQAELVARPEVVPSAVEELLRWESPVPFVPRRATRDVTVGGVHIAAGSSVGMFLGSANTDERSTEHADVVDFEREPNRHMAFGRGIHRCLGSHLARLELKVALQVLHSRIPSYQIAPDTVLRWHAGNRALDELPLVFPAGAPA